MTTTLSLPPLQPSVTWGPYEFRAGQPVRFCRGVINAAGLDEWYGVVVGGIPANPNRPETPVLAVRVGGTDAKLPIPRWVPDDPNLMLIPASSVHRTVSWIDAPQSYASHSISMDGTEFLLAHLPEVPVTR